MLSPQDVTYFLAMAQHLSLRAAAAELHITQPALSHSLKRLETQLDSQLFERTAKGLRLTPAGQRLQSESQSLLPQWQSLSQKSSSQLGRLRVGMHASVATYMAPTLLRHFMEKDLTLGMELVHSLSRDLVRQVLEGELDLALAMNPSEHPSLVIREILDDHVEVYAAARRTFVAEHLIYDPALAQSQWILKSLRRAGHEFRTHTHSGSLEVIRAIAEEGMGAAILPARVAALSRKPLRPLLKSGPRYRDRLCIVTRPHFAQHEPGQTWLKSLRELARTEFSEP